MYPLLAISQQLALILYLSKENKTCLIISCKSFVKGQFYLICAWILHARAKIMFMLLLGAKTEDKIIKCKHCLEMEGSKVLVISSNMRVRSMPHLHGFFGHVHGILN